MAVVNFLSKNNHKKKKNLSAIGTVATITKFLWDTRVFQLTNLDIPFTQVYNRDQIPIALASSYFKSIDDKNKEVIWDATHDSVDVKRFCSLNLTILMEVDSDLSNIVRPHLVFRATKFVRGEDWKQRDEHGHLERDLWNDRVDVSFQANAWVDAHTNLYGLEKAKIIFDQYEKFVQFENNLSAHKTPAVCSF